MSGASGVGPEHIVAFWREAGPKKWFSKNADFDRAIVERFGQLHAEAAVGRLEAWAGTPEGALALVLLLDQFSRNLYRGDPRAFAQDAMGLAIARRSIESDLDRMAPADLRSFFFTPFMHSETIADQEQSVLLHHAHAPNNLSYARDHERIIRRFGRFPHRNAVLGRHTSPAEQAFLDGGGFAG